MSVAQDEIDVHSDERGFVFEPLKSGEFSNQKNGHVVISEPKAVRGNHFHENGTEIIVVVGPALFRFLEDNVTRDVEVPDRKAYRFTIPPNIPHAIQNTGDRPNILVAFNSLELDRNQPDVVKHILISP